MTPSFQIYARGLIFNSQNEVLLIKKRTDQKYAPGKWIFPGGTVEWGEDADAALARELKEEIDADVCQFKMIGTRKIITGEIHWQGIYYHVRVSNLSDLKNCEPHKHEVIAWFHTDRLPSDMDEIDRAHLGAALSA